MCGRAPFSIFLTAFLASKHFVVDCVCDNVFLICTWFTVRNIFQLLISLSIGFASKWYIRVVRPSTPPPLESLSYYLGHKLWTTVLQYCFRLPEPREHLPFEYIHDRFGSRLF